MLTYNLTFIFYGFLAIVSQLIIFRELSIVFYGNELFIGTALSAWLFWVGVGSIKRFFSRNLAHLFTLAAILLPLEIIAIRVVKSFFYFGSILGPLPMFATTFIALCPYCLLIGSMFPVACGLAGEKCADETALKRVYYLECLGSVLGGILFTYFFVGNIPLFYLALILSALTLRVPWVLFIKNKKRPSLALIGAGVLIFVFAIFAKEIQSTSRKIEWGKFNLLKETESRYAHLALARMGSLKLFFENGLLCAQFPLPQFYEESVHWPMLLSSAPKNILVVGNALTGTLEQVFKYDVERVDYATLDRKSTRLLKPHLEKEDVAALLNPRLFIHYSDVRFWLKAHPRQYDVIILNIPEPANAQENRFYTQEFYRELSLRLAPGGILAFSLPSAAEYLQAETQIFNASIYQTLKSVFASVDFVPGDNLLFLASPSPINLDGRQLAENYELRRIQNQYVVPGYFPYKLSAERRQYTLEKLESKGARINRDFSPIAYYYFSKLWLEKFSSPNYFLLSLIFLGLLSWVIARVYKKRGQLVKYRYYIFIFLFGFMSMLLEMVLILTFQAFTGYIYWQMGALFAGFMFGLFLGSVLIAPRKEKPKQKRYLNGLVFISLIFSLGLAIFLPFASRLNYPALLIIFPLLLMATGMILGSSFPLSGYLAMPQDGLEKVSGSLYAADLWGGSLSALLSGLLIIPLLGLRGAIILALLVQLLALVAVNKD